MSDTDLKSMEYFGLAGLEFWETGGGCTANFTFHIDRRHGWLEVPACELHRVGLTIADDISDFSYIYQPQAGGTTVFLEEDCDAPKFIRAFCKKEQIPAGLFPVARTIHYDGDAPIRGMRRLG